MAEYQLAANGSVIRSSDGATIPNSMQNRDYREYERWVSAGNAPDPVDVPTPVSEEDRVEQALVGSPELNAFIKAIAKRLSISQRQLLDDIRTEAKGAPS